MSKKRLLFLTVLFLSLGGVAAFFVVGAGPSPDSSLVLARTRVFLQGEDRPVAPFDVELATTPEQHSRGLMLRAALPRGQGMLFRFDPPQTVSFWMKDTLIPLDMLFIRADGSIAKIEASAAPGDLTPISSGEPVAFVLEIGGGETRRLGFDRDSRLLEKAPESEGTKAVPIR